MKEVWAEIGRSLFTSTFLAALIFVLITSLAAIILLWICDNTLMPLEVDMQHVHIISENN